ncbi:UNVERIFIED_CONTAM: hypothetical protein Sradi_1774500 [Sesamum radiatum]|uniref:Uncharacterized protein n=1 Tax=Sesamum radiatum TaxID=300843 RepID=A0AAW2TYD8_SESRA
MRPFRFLNILTERFWKRARECCAVMEPLVRVLKAVDQDKKPTLCIIYEAMDRAKMAIKASVRKWEKYWEIIDDRWYRQLYRQLHRHLHAAEVRRGVKEVIKRLESDLIVQANAMNEIRLFVDKLGEFGSPLARQAVSTSLPDEWTREAEEPLLPENDLDWLDEEGRMDNVQMMKMMMRRFLYLVGLFHGHQKGKDKHVLHSSSTQNDSDDEIAEDDDNDDDDSDDDDDGGNDGGGNVHKDTQQSHGMTWAEGDENYYATQDTDHGYRPELRINVGSYPI